MNKEYGIDHSINHTLKIKITMRLKSIRNKLIKRGFLKQKYRKNQARNKICVRKRFIMYGLPSLALQLVAKLSIAQADGNAGITEATTLIKGYFSTGVNLMYAIGAVVGLIGAIKVYNKWSAGDPDTTKVASSWFGACIFLVVVATVLKSFFSI